jgi:hypothetical protein
MAREEGPSVSMSVKYNLPTKVADITVNGSLVQWEAGVALRVFMW